MPFPPFPENEMNNQAAQTMPKARRFPDGTFRIAVNIGGVGFISDPFVSPKSHGDAMKAVAAALSQTAGVPDVLFDGYAVYQGMSDEARARINAGGVSDVLDSVVRLIRAQAAPAASGGEGPTLHPATEDLIRRFSDALREKLSSAEKKYGYSDGWASPDWMDQCRRHLDQHVAKGDPRDVAAYCAFLWHHGEPTTKRDRDADRKRFPDDDFNAWLDVGISDAGHTVYDSLSSIEDAWQGWHGHVLSVMSDENPVFDDLAIDSPTPAASVSERARELRERAEAHGGGVFVSIGDIRALEQALTQPSDAQRERDLLAEAIGNAGIKCGLLRKDIEGLTGPQLLMVCDDMAEALTQQRVESVAWLTDSALRALTSEDPNVGAVVYARKERSPDYRIPVYTTPQPSADAVRELVAEWRRVAQKFHDMGSSISIAEGAVMRNLADELESLLSGEPHA